ncbi:MAG TPA: MFS transporter [Pirellulales bacterium]|jgi:MFS family permease|nr:MFS transporter [Pirellulales bacterium]
MKNHDSSASSSRLLRTVPLLMLVVACGHFNRIGISVAGTEQIIPRQGITPERMGLVYSAFLAFYTLAMLPGGWLIDRYGTRAALMLWGFGSAVLVALTGVTGLICHDATSLWLALLVVRSLLGAVNAPLHPAAAHLVYQRVAQPVKSLANGLVTFAACVGIAATYTGMGSMIDWLGWPHAFVVSGGMTLAVAIVWTLITRPAIATPGKSAAHSRGTINFAGLSSVLRRRSVICLTLGYAAQGYFQYLFFYWIEYFFETIQHQPTTAARGYNTLITLVMGAGMICGGWLTDHAGRAFASRRLRRAIVPVLAMVGSGAVFELGLLAPDPHVTLGAFTIAAGLIGACEGAFWTTSVELGGRLGGTTAGLMNAGGNLGGCLSPYFTPLLGRIFTEHYGEETGWRMGLAVAGVIVIAGAASWLGVRPAEEG